jgi:hypothetical protein
MIAYLIVCKKYFRAPKFHQYVTKAAKSFESIKYNPKNSVKLQIKTVFIPNPIPVIIA